MASTGSAFGSESPRADVLGIGSREGHQVFSPSLMRWGFEMHILTSKA